MAVDHNPTYVRTLALAAGISYGALWGLEAMSLEALAISSIPDFQKAFPCIIRWPSLFFFRSLFVCLKLAW